MSAINTFGLILIVILMIGTICVCMSLRHNVSILKTQIHHLQISHDKILDDIKCSMKDNIEEYKKTNTETIRQMYKINYLNNQNVLKKTKSLYSPPQDYDINQELNQEQEKNLCKYISDANTGTTNNDSIYLSPSPNKQSYENEFVKICEMHNVEPNALCESSDTMDTMSESSDSTISDANVSVLEKEKDIEEDIEEDKEEHEEEIGEKTEQKPVEQEKMQIKLKDFAKYSVAELRDICKKYGIQTRDENGKLIIKETLYSELKKKNT